MNFDHDLEYLVIGNALMKEQAVMQMVDVIKTPDVFTDRDTKTAYKAIRELFMSSEVIDLITVAKVAKKRYRVDETAFQMFLMECTGRVTFVNQQEHCMLLLQLFIRRRLFDAGHKLMNMSSDQGRDTLELLATAAQEIQGIDKDVQMETSQKWPDVVDSLIDKLLSQSQGKLPRGITTGITKLDNVIGGFTPGQLVTIAGRPGMGKSAFAQSIIVHCAERYGPVLLISREMGAEDIAGRVVASHTDLNMAEIFGGSITTNQVEYLKKNSGYIKNLPVHVDEVSISLDQVIYSIRKKVSQEGARLIVIDYIHLIRGFEGKRYSGDTEKLTDITRELKSLSTLIKVPIIILSQLNRDVENRGGRKVPQLSDLKQSGSIEEDSNMVIFLYRPEQYDIYEFEDGSPAAGKVEVIVAKNRNGRTGKVRANFDGMKMRFSDESEPNYLTSPSPNDGPF